MRESYPRKSWLQDIHTLIMAWLLIKLPSLSSCFCFAWLWLQWLELGFMWLKSKATGRLSCPNSHSSPASTTSLKWSPRPSLASMGSGSSPWLWSFCFTQREWSSITRRRHISKNQSRIPHRSLESSFVPNSMWIPSSSWLLSYWHDLFCKDSRRMVELTFCKSSWGDSCDWLHHW